MNRQEKEMLVQDLRGRFSDSQAAFLVGVQGLTVAQMQQLRRSVRAKDGSMLVAKNTLLDLAAAEVDGVADLRPHFRSQLAIVFAKSDVPGIAKVLFDASKEFEKLEASAGYFEGAVLTKQKIEFLATLPPREVLLAQVCAGIQAPISGFASVLHQMVVRLLYVLKQASEKQS